MMGWCRGLLESGLLPTDLFLFSLLLQRQLVEVDRDAAGGRHVNSAVDLDLEVGFVYLIDDLVVHGARIDDHAFPRRFRADDVAVGGEGAEFKFANDHFEAP